MDAFLLAFTRKPDVTEHLYLANATTTQGTQVVQLLLSICRPAKDGLKGVVNKITI